MSIKKGWKITWISLGSLLGLIIILTVVALWLVFTPSRLTKIVNGLVGDFVTCDAHFENVDLTLLSTFPDAGLRIDNVVLVNPTEGAPSDTLARVGSLTVGIDVMAYLRDNKVIVHQVKLDDAVANLYIAKDGHTNFDIISPSSDTTQSDSKMPEEIDLQKIVLGNLSAMLKDERDGMDAEVQGLDLRLKGNMKGDDIDADLKVGGRQVSFAMNTAEGVQTLAAMLKDVDIDIDGSLKGEAVEADVDIDGGEVELAMCDSSGAQTLSTALRGVTLTLKGAGTQDNAEGKLCLKLKKGTLNAAGSEMVNKTLQASDEKLLEAEIPFTANWRQRKVTLKESSVKVDDYAFSIGGDAQLSTESQPMQVDLGMKTDGAWRIKSLLEIIPGNYKGMLEGMDIDGKVSLEATAKGAVTDSTMPLVDAQVKLAGGTFDYPAVMPYKLNKINGNASAHLDLGKGGVSSAKVSSLTARTRGSELSLSGRADDLTGDMRVDATVKGSLPLVDLIPLIPEGMKVEAKGDANLDLHANFRMSQLLKQNFDKVKANGTLKVRNFNLTYDTIHATTPSLDVALQLPAKEHKGMLADARIKGGDLKVTMGDDIEATIETPNVSVGINNIMKQQLAASFDIKIGETEATMDSMLLSLAELKLKGSVRLDSTESNILKQYNPLFEASTHSAVFYSPQLPDAVRLSELEVDYKPNNCNIGNVQVRVGHSDFALYGTLENLEEWMSDKAMLKGDLNFTSNYADIDQLMDMVSGLGSDKDSLELMRKEDAVPEDAHPFIVPKSVDITFHTHIQRSVAFGNDLNDVAGSLTVKDGVAVLDQMGFVCKAATMQLTALYRTPRPSNLFCALDFHLLDIQVAELIDMIPCIDTLVPMLSAFDGNANFHLAGETYLNARYEPKLSSLMGAAAISGNDLVVMDNSKTATIAKLMRFKSWKDKDNKIRVDSMSVEMTCMDVGFGTEIEILPFLLNIGSYKICASGVQALGSGCNYHLELLKNPLLVKVGVDVKGSLDNPKISLGEVRYSDLYRPKKQGAAEKKALEIKSKVRKALESNVR